MTRDDVEAILFLSDTFEWASADKLAEMYKDFLNSTFNKPELDIYTCLNQYVGYLLYSGQTIR